MSTVFCARRQHLLRFVCGAHIRSSLVQSILERGRRLAELGWAELSRTALNRAQL